MDGANQAGCNDELQTGSRHAYVRFWPLSKMSEQDLSANLGGTTEASVPSIFEGGRLFLSSGNRGKNSVSNDSRR